MSERQWRGKNGSDGLIHSGRRQHNWNHNSSGDHALIVHQPEKTRPGQRLLSNKEEIERKNALDRSRSAFSFLKFFAVLPSSLWTGFQEIAVSEPEMLKKWNFLTADTSTQASTTWLLHYIPEPSDEIYEPPKPLIAKLPLIVSAHKNRELQIVEIVANSATASGLGLELLEYCQVKSVYSDRLERFMRNVFPMCGLELLENNWRFVDENLRIRLQKLDKKKVDECKLARNRALLKAGKLKSQVIEY